MDSRWENVSAYVGPPQGYINDGEGNEDFWANYIEFLIEVRFDGQVFYFKMYVDKRDLNDARVDTYKWVLNKMVDQVDYYIDEYKKE